MREIRQWDVFWCKLPNIGGCVQHGRRLVAVISNDFQNKTSDAIMIIPLTTSFPKIKVTPEVFIRESLNGMTSLVKNTALCNQIMTIKKDDLLQNVGELSDDSRRLVHQGIFKSIRSANSI